ncbi:hypothetical protein A4G99_17085 [Haladaptatus sp. R4]|uniref:hypothetical protein n=1 Tax=Haladaptatus sp. R4 TaxID=1679489 RepID=UPI0007B4F6A1|nr:hypothetical protein [Haladaptatus sp. R4]KZN22822.1 hypothetical protein A4G99_17085 [Haladaptatus sp. R4]
MSKDLPTRERSARERGTFAKHADDPTVASYLSSLFFLLSVPVLLLVTFVGHSYGLYSYGAIVPAFAGLLFVAITLVFVIMHVRTR